LPVRHAALPADGTADRGLARRRTSPGDDLKGGFAGADEIHAVGAAPAASPAGATQRRVATAAGDQRLEVRLRLVAAAPAEDQHGHELEASELRGVDRSASGIISRMYGPQTAEQTDTEGIKPSRAETGGDPGATRARLAVGNAA
jgi:hypothetical protein